VNIYLTGATGQVGIECRQALAEQHNVDITRFDLIEQCGDACAYILKHDFDCVINAAAYTAVDAAETPEGEKASLLLNAILPARLAATCESKKIPLIHISTDYIFDGAKLGSYSETDISNPLSIYGSHKLKGEQAVAVIARAHYILRTSWVYSEHRTNFVKTMLKIGRSLKTLTVVNDQIGGPTSARQIANVIKVIVGDLEKQAYGIYHFSATPPTSWFDFAEAIFDVAQICDASYPKPELLPISTKEYAKPGSAARPLNSRLDCSKIQKMFKIEQPDWHPELGQIVKKLLS